MPYREAPLIDFKMGEAWNPEQERVLCILPFPEPTELIEKIEKKHPNVKFLYHSLAWKPYEPQAQADIDKNYPWEEATILYTFATLPSDPKLAPNLKFIHFPSAGTNHVANTPIYKDTNIPLTTSSGIHGPQIAEWVVMQLLNHSHHEKKLLQWQKEHVWGSHGDMGLVRDSVGQRLGVLGYGSIGRQAGKVAEALGMDVIAYTASPRNTPESKKDTGYIVPGTGDPDGTIPSAWYSGLDKASLHNFLKQDIDVLLVAVPLTEQTTHFLGKEEFEILGKRNAFITNIARGSIIQQDDLIAALKKKEGGLRGAALDVTDPEPLNKESELWDLENVAITPHVSGQATTYQERSLAILELNLTNLEEGKPLINVVNRKRGY